jgi:hypothetical protein
MKAAKKSKDSFGGGNVAGDSKVNQHKRLAMGKQGRVSVTKNPGSKGSRKPGMKKS